MCQFKIVSLEQQPYDAVIFSVSYDSPLAYLNEVADEIRKNHFKNAKILFDVLLSIGNTTERFIEATFDGEQFNLNSFRVIQIKKNNQIRKYCADFFHENSNLLEHSILTPIQKELLKKGAVI